MNAPAPVDTIAHAIELSVTPVFLLAGVGAILAVLANRLARIVDRGRVLHERRHRGADDHDTRAELDVIRIRMRVVNAAIISCTLCALLICSVVGVLFLGTLTAHGSAAPIAFLFVGAMSCLIVALLLFLVEIYLATMKIPLRW